MFYYLCPICTELLKLNSSATSYQCQHQHCFDIAKDGYLNLLPVQHKGSKEPGDNKQMMTARRAFLEAGFYAPMAKAVAMMINANSTEHQALTLLDIGCGEGYYSRTIAHYGQQNPPIALHGVDIAKFAIAAAAKKQPAARFIVASSNRLPYPKQTFDWLLKVFAPANDDELKRLLKPAGFLLTVTPGPRHLWQLKQFIYSDVREHALDAPLPVDFVSIDSQRLRYQITPDADQRIALLQMTPFAWRANKSCQQTLKDAPAFSIDTDFILTLAIKS